MKSFALGLLLFASFAAATRAQPKNNVEKSGFAGRVKSVVSGSIEYTLSDGKSVEGRRIPNGKITFDERGRQVEGVSYDKAGAVLARVVYTYDSAGRSTGYDEYSSLVDKSLSKPRRHIYALDGEGRTVEYTVYDSDGTLASRFTYAYDAEGNKTEEAFYSWNGSRSGKLTYTYDEQGRLLTQTSHNADDKVSWKNVNTYDAEGHKTESVQYQGDKLRYKFLYKYDAKGRVKEEETREFNAEPNVHVSHAPEPGKVVYLYDDEKRTKEATAYDERGAFKSRLVYAFDDKGNDLGVRALNPDGSPESSELHWYDKGVQLRTLNGIPSVKFEYDAQGNWTRKTHLIKSADAEKPEAHAAEYREITYY